MSGLPVSGRRSALLRCRTSANTGQSRQIFRAATEPQRRGFRETLTLLRVVAQTACDVVANLNLHSGLAEVDIAAVVQFKSHHILHDLLYRESKPIRGDS